MVLVVFLSREVSMLGSVNQSVTDFLNYYADERRAFDYAVLLDGAWGSGKTHLANSFLNAHAAHGGKHLYVSLYGMTSTRQIEEEFIGYFIRSFRRKACAWLEYCCEASPKAS
jgi:chromosomal replication initiation ATPase DnaA